MMIPVSESELDALQQLVGERYRPLSLLGKKSGRKTLLAEDSETNAQVVIKLLTFGWFSQTLGQALQLPEDLEENYFVDDASKAAKNLGGQ